MKNRILPRKLRRQKRTELVTGVWTWGDTVTFGNIDSGSIIYFDSDTTTITFPSGTENGFQVGDIITILGHNPNKIKKKKKVHVARRRQQKKQITHTITDVSATTMTINTNESLALTKFSERDWIVNGTIT